MDGSIPGIEHEARIGAPRAKTLPVDEHMVFVVHHACAPVQPQGAERPVPFGFVKPDARFGLGHDFAQRAGPLQVRWMMIPNKTTVYLDTGRAQGFANRARELGIGPDLFAVARAGRHAMRDLYWPNDNHWSMRGQLYFGDHMRHYVQDRIGAPSSKQ
jgi:hypothetical protein